jgi:hypothetical protein
VLLGLESTTSIEGTTKLCESASAPGFARTGASGVPDRTRLPTYQWHNLSARQRFSVLSLGCQRKPALVAENHDA